MEIQPAQRCGVESQAAPWSVCGKIASKWFYIIQSDFSQEVAASPDHLGVSVIAIETYPPPPPTIGQMRRAPGWEAACRLLLTNLWNNTMQN